MLLQGNPFLDLAKRIRVSYDPTAGHEYVPDCDAEQIAKKKSAITKAVNEGKPNALKLNVSPSPFLGDVENAKIVILSLNPGFGDLNVGGWKNLTDSEKQAYAEIEADEMSLQSKGFGTTITDPIFQAMNGVYWLEKLRPLMDAKGYAPRSANEKNALDKFALIDLFPYHSQSSPMSVGGILPSQKWIFDVVIPHVVANADIVVIVRANRKWLDNAPILACPNNYAKVYTLNSPQNTTFSEGNMPEECWNKIIKLI